MSCWFKINPRGIEDTAAGCTYEFIPLCLGDGIHPRGTEGTEAN
ncbi:hypothetical protein [[Phormidium] sp. ETS-05]|nr:hypothetical protein [[Phormidium] sp. ETS-05]